MASPRVSSMKHGGVQAEWFGWTLLSLGLIAFVAGGVYLLGLMAQAWIFLDSFGSTNPVLLQLRPSFTLPAAVVTHHC